MAAEKHAGKNKAYKKGEPNMKYQLKATLNSLTFTFSAWDQDTYILLPACAYNGNRFKSVKRAYPPMYTQEERGVHAPTTITDVPRLNPDGSGKIEITTGDMATPCVGLYSPTNQEGFLLFFTQGANSKNFGVTVSAGKIEITGAPQRELAYRWPYLVPSGDEGLREAVEIPHKIIEFPCTSIEGLFDKFFENRKCMGMDDTRPQNKSASELFSIQEKKFNAMNFRENRYYGVGTTDEPCQDWQCGWVGGAMSSYPLLKLGNEETKKRAVSTLEFLFSTQAPSGFFPGTYHKGQFYGDGFSENGMDNSLLIRKNADVLYFLFKHFDCMNTVPASFEQGAKKCADAFVKLWDTYGQFGQFINYQTGEIIVGGTTSGGIAPAGLMRAYSYFGDDNYRRVAKQAAQFYYDRDVKNGVMNGGPGEILGGPDSESSFGLLESFVVLYETTKEEKWLNYAQSCLKQCASWVVSYNYEFPKDSEFGKRGVKTVGSVFANVQNKHSAPGICTLSGDSILKLYRWTGNEQYKELIQDIAAFIPQCLSTEENPVHAHDGSILPGGFICERVNMSDWEGYDWIGAVFNGSCWCETSLLLTLAEIDL